MQDFNLWITSQLQLNGKQYVDGIPIFAPIESDESPLVNEYWGPLHAVTANICKPLGKRQVLLTLTERRRFIWECSALDFPRGEFLLTSTQQRVIFRGPARIDNASNLFPDKTHRCNAFMLNGLFCILHANSGNWFSTWFKKPSNVFLLTVFGSQNEQLNKQSNSELFRLREYIGDPILKVANVNLDLDSRVWPSP